MTLIRSRGTNLQIDCLYQPTHLVLTDKQIIYYSIFIGHDLDRKNPQLFPFFFGFPVGPGPVPGARKNDLGQGARIFTKNVWFIYI